MLENSRKKLLQKNADMIVANNLRQDGAGFGVDTITKGDCLELPQMSKEEAAVKILDFIKKTKKA